MENLWRRLKAKQLAEKADRSTLPCFTERLQNPTGTCLRFYILWEQLTEISRITEFAQGIEIRNIVIPTTQQFWVGSYGECVEVPLESR